MNKKSGTRPPAGGGELAALRNAVRTLRRGGLVIFPTETAYGIAADPRQRRAVAAVFKVKGRPTGKPLPLIAASMVQARRVALFSGLGGRAAVALTRALWPGPLTLVLPVHPRARLAPHVCGAGNTIAVRVSAHRTARALARLLGFPIIATSANRAGAPAPYSLKDALRSLGARARGVYALDGGTLPRRLPSTIVRIGYIGAQGTATGFPGFTIVRRGAVSATAIRRALKK